MYAGLELAKQAYQRTLFETHCPTAFCGAGGNFQTQDEMERLAKWRLGKIRAVIEWHKVQERKRHED